MEHLQAGESGRDLKEFQEAYIQIKGVLTPDQRKDLQDARLAAAKERAEIIATGGGAPGVPKKVADKATERISPALDVVQRLDEGIQGIVDQPSAVGPKGFFIDHMGGMIRLLEEATGVKGAVSKPLGVDEIRRVRSVLENTVGPLIPTITGDTSGRYSNSDRAVADQAFNALKVSTSPEDALISLSVIRDITMRGLLRDINISGPQGQAMLKAMNITPEQLEQKRFAALVGKDGEYEYKRIWYDNGQLWAEKTDGTKGRLKWK